MSPNVADLILKMDMTDVEIQLAMQCAPVITGVKIANLLILESAQMQAIYSLFKNSYLSYYVLLKTERRTVLLLYEPESLQRYLSDRRIHSFFGSMGYEKMSLEDILLHVHTRYQAYYEGQQSFPHEVGLLLGYPLEDVMGFVWYKGKNYLYTGYWKVYANVMAKKLLFDQYDMAKELLLHLLVNGAGMQDIILYYCGELTKTDKS